ncbi:DUF262 domain-containing protein [Pedobacter puniceum]|uniref:DUF262 domain-containing protein n=1 Tax=Pedobacter puniceum TaxID=2666136 RepID=A0A7K0FQN6_9SPHI|nr:DUF262 domain-containing protein [Pedobacter puniceum]MRX48264.1 DUF262 domain-containing protein [Pedobacter puniceum]
MSNNISIKPISELLGMNFFIPAYQRGYRWTEQQVTELLNDIWDFINKPNKKDDEFYCLQPVVVIKSDDKTKNNNNLIGDWYDVIDGQQRLTTTFLVLKNLERFVESERNNFKIQYETRKGSEDFLIKLDSKSEVDSKKNVDYFHIYNSHTTIKTWFQKKVNEGHTSISSKFITPFLEKVKIIWYETSKKDESENNDDSIDIFTRINSGKIPLTNAELIKALFLNSSNFAQADNEKLRLKQLEIASEWDRIEYALQDDSFWYFINKNENNLATRIEFIFNLMSDKPSDDKYSTFHFFNEKFKTKSEKEINDNWKEIKKYFQTLEEWYNNRELYHKIGYLITVGTDLKTILNEKKEKSKTEFSYWIDQKIKSKFENVNLKEVEYNGKYVREILLLHNIQTMLNNENETNRFPFDRYKKEFWDVEHIHAIATEVKVKKENQVEWLKNNFIKTDNHQNEEFNNKICCTIHDNNLIDENEFKSIVEYVLGEEDNKLQNLCLLDRGTNRSYKNDSFKEKRRKIIEREMNGTFIPICTKNVFMKYYSANVKDIEVWNENDRTSYFEKIQKVINQYLPQAILSENEL